MNVYLVCQLILRKKTASIYRKLASMGQNILFYHKKINISLSQHEICHILIGFFIRYVLFSKRLQISLWKCLKKHSHKSKISSLLHLTVCFIFLCVGNFICFINFVDIFLTQIWNVNLSNTFPVLVTSMYPNNSNVMSCPVSVKRYWNNLKVYF